MKLFRRVGKIEFYAKGNIIYDGLETVSEVAIKKEGKMFYEYKTNNWIMFLKTNNKYQSFESCIPNVAFLLNNYEGDLIGIKGLIEGYIIDRKCSSEIAIKRINRKIKEEQKEREIYKQQQLRIKERKKEFETILKEVKALINKKKGKVYEPNEHNDYKYSFYCDDLVFKMDKPYFFNEIDFEKIKQIKTTLKKRE